MNRITIIGNLTREPELRTTQSGKSVCSFTVAVNGRNDKTDYFRVTAWDKLADNCHNYLDKGRKVAVVGSVSLNTYTASNGENRANMDVVASEVEFLSPKAGDQSNAPQTANNGYTEIGDEDLPW